MIGLTEHQRRLLDYLESFIAQSGGIAPTFTQMMVHMDMVSKSGIHRLLSALEERGAIRRIPHRARAIEILNPAPDLTTVPVQTLLAELARRGLHPVLSGVRTPEAHLPEPLLSPPVTSGSGSSVPAFHDTEIAHA